MHPLRPDSRQILTAVILLTLAVGAVFFPILDFEFINYDATYTVIDNPHIRGISGENLRQMFTSRCVTSYYPVRSLSYALDFQLWGLNPRGFKLTNGLIHLANTLLVFWLVLRLFGHSPTAGRPCKRWWDVNAAVLIAAGGILAVLAVVSAGQVRTWRNSLTLWEACVQAEPHSARAHIYLSDCLAAYGQLDRATKHFAIAVRLDSNILAMINQLVLELATAEPENRRDYERALTLARHACQLTEWEDPEYLRTLAVVHGNLAESLRGREGIGRVRDNYQTAIELAQAAGDADLASKFQRGLDACDVRGIDGPAKSLRIQGVRQPSK